jgi:hypothetical protein
MRWISWPAVNLLGSQEGLCSMDLEITALFTIIVEFFLFSLEWPSWRLLILSNLNNTGNILVVFWGLHYDVVSQSAYRGSNGTNVCIWRGGGTAPSAFWGYCHGICVRRMITLRVAAVMTTAASTETCNRQLSTTVAEHDHKISPFVKHECVLIVCYEHI